MSEINDAAKLSNDIFKVIAHLIFGETITFCFFLVEVVDNVLKYNFQACFVPTLFIMIVFPTSQSFLRSRYNPSFPYRVTLYLELFCSDNIHVPLFSNKIKSITNHNQNTVLKVAFSLRANWSVFVPSSTPINVQNCYQATWHPYLINIPKYFLLYSQNGPLFELLIRSGKQMIVILLQTLPF